MICIRPLFVKRSYRSIVSRRFLGSLPKEENQGKDIYNGPNENKVIYEAPMKAPVRMMKRVSVLSCALTTLGMPLVCYLSTPATSIVAQSAMCGTVVLFGMGTTSLFHFLFKPYITQMWLKTDNKTQDVILKVEKFNFFSFLKYDNIKLSQITPVTKSLHPMVSFKAKNESYFIHPECFLENNQEKLLEKLIGKEKLKDVIDKQNKLNAESKNI